MNWVEKYRPKKFENVKGQDEAINKINNFMSHFNSKALTKRKGKNALILHGSPGLGKTTLAYVVANENKTEIFELNASDLRNRDKLREVLKPAIEQKSLIKNNKIILVDEVDGISSVDRGGLQELLSLIALTNYPVIITANDIWNKKFNNLRKVSEIIQLKEINYNIMKDIMFSILRKEGLFIDNNIITKIAIQSKGDLRAAINDLQTIATSKEESPTIFERNKEVDIFNALRMIFKGKPNQELLNIFNSVKMPIDEILLWVEENIPTEYNGPELLRACEMLEKADLFRGRIYKQQYWRFLVYENIFLSYGISASKKNPKTGFTSYKKPTRILKIWLNNQKTAKKKSIAKKYARLVHIGEKRALREFPILKSIIASNPEIQKQLRLEDDEIEFLMV